MDYRRWTEMQQHSLIPNSSLTDSYSLNPNPSLTDSYSHLYNAHSSYTHYPYYSDQLQNPNQTLTPPPQTILKRYDDPRSHYDIVPDAAGLRQPGIESYAAMNSYTHHHVGVGFERQTAVASVYSHQPKAVASSYGHQPAQVGAFPTTASYYQEPSAGTQNWALKEAIRQYGADPVTYAAAGMRPSNEMEQLVTATRNPVSWSNSKRRPPENGAWRREQKKIKVVQSAWCEVCKADCNTKGVLDQHKLGKRHKKNLEKLDKSKKNPNVVTPAAASVTKNAVIPNENHMADKGKAVALQQLKRKAAPPLVSKEDLQEKKRKVLEGGAAADAVRVCTLCNVVCNSETVFNYHIQGQKHAAMVMKQEA